MKILVCTLCGVIQVLPSTSIPLALLGTMAQSLKNVTKNSNLFINVIIIIVYKCQTNF